VELSPIPALGGARFGVFRLQPDPESTGPGLHATQAVDLAIVMAGEVVLELDSGEKKTLRAGDALGRTQRRTGGTTKAQRSRSSR